MEFELKRGGHKDLKRIYPMMEFDFHGDGLVEEEYLQRAMLQGAGELLLLKDLDGTELGYAYIQKNRLCGYVLLAYLGVYPTFRGVGAGTRFLELMMEYYVGTQGMLLEMFGDVTQGDPKRRHDLYEKLGWRDVRCDYKLLGVPTKLMLRRISGPEDIGPVVAAIVNALYRDVLPERKLREFVSCLPESGEGE